MYNLTYNTPYHKNVYDWYKSQPGFNDPRKYGEYSYDKNDKRLMGRGFQNNPGVINKPASFLNSHGSNYIKFDNSMTNSYYRVGSKPTNPRFNRNDLEKINMVGNTGKVLPLVGGDFVSGDSKKNLSYGKLVDEIVRLLDIDNNDYSTKGGGISASKVKRKLLPIAKKVASVGLDVATPVASTALGTAIGTAVGNPVLGAVSGKIVGKIARAGIKEVTGLGMKTRPNPKVGYYKRK